MNLSPYSKRVLYTCLSICGLMGGIYGGYTGYTYYISKYGFIEHANYGSDAAWSIINSKSLFKKVSPSYAPNFYSILMPRIQTSRDSALQLYNEAIVNTIGNPILTGKDGVPVATANKINELNSKISHSKLRKEKSDLYLEKSKLLYQIGDALYFEKNNNHQLAIIYYYLLSLESAQRSINEVNNSGANIHMGVVLMDIGVDMADVYAYLKIGLSLDPTNSYSYYKLGNAYKHDGKYNEAIETYLSGLTVNPHDEMIYINLGVVYGEKNDIDKAIANLRKAIPYCKDFCHTMYYNLGVDLKNTGKGTKEEYTKYIKSAIEEGKRQGKIYRNAYRVLGAIEHESGNLDAGIENLLISLNNENDKECGTNCFNQNDSEEATYYYLGKIYLDKNDMTNAKKYIYQGLYKYPNSSLLQDLESKIKNHFIDLT